MINGYPALSRKFPLPMWPNPDLAPCHVRHGCCKDYELAIELYQTALRDESVVSRAGFDIYSRLAEATETDRRRSQNNH